MRTIFYFVTFLSVLISCTNDENIESLIPPSPEETIYQADEEKAVAAFYDFLNNLNKNVQTKSSQDIVVSKIRKTSAQTYKDSNFRQTKAGEEAPIYELTLNNGNNSEGYAIVANFGNSDEVLAYTPMGAITDTTFNIGLAAFFRSLSDFMDLCQDDIKTKADIWQQGWDSRPGVAIPGTKKFSHYLTYAEGNEIISRYGKWAYFDPVDDIQMNTSFVPVQWDQLPPYNDKVNSYFYQNGVKTRAYVGCCAVALGQLMSYYQKPAKYDWRTLTALPKISTSNTNAASKVSQLLIDIATVAKTTFTSSGAGSTPTINNTPTLQHFGYNVKEINLDTQPSSALIAAEIKQKRPILMCAQSNIGGHIWVVDGIYSQERWYNSLTLHVSQDGEKYSLNKERWRLNMIHCNWGWGGLSDGWYYNYAPLLRDGRYVYFDRGKKLYTEVTPK